MTLPRATMRLQFHAGFTFDDAVRLAPYLRALGISHLYASPILTARAGSRHGYDIVDPRAINPELGGEEGLRRLVRVLRRHGLGLILDIVPNHMAVGGGDNPWWLDVLEHGRTSAYARFFDIDWQGDPDLKGKLLAPFLGKPYGAALAAGEIRLGRNPLNSRPATLYYHHVFPLRSGDAAIVARDGEARFDPATPNGRARLHALLERQHYRLAWWRTAPDMINWRRFFDITELAGLCVEDEPVFDAVHATLLRLYREGLVDGFRIDHVDGLTDPAGYCRKLWATLATLDAARPADAPPGPAYLVVEKILAVGETLPRDWQVDGTTGYDFMDQVSALLHDAEGQQPLDPLWQEISGRSADFEAEETCARREILARSFPAQHEAATAALHALLARDPATRDWSRPAVARVLAEILVQLRVYRSYAGQPSAPLDAAIRHARGYCRPAERPLLDLLAGFLRDGAGGDTLEARARARFRQLSAPIAAKSVEDTAFYRYGRLLSRTDVGFDPRRFALGVDDFHQAMLDRFATLPQAMLATATHDHKRGEDVRARLAVLSEMPARWAEVLSAALTASAPWRQATPDGPAPSDGDRAILMQMIVGAWPLDLDPDDLAGGAAFAERLAQWQVKALREAKLRTSWDMPDEAYEAAAAAFLARLFADRNTAGVRALLAGFVREIAAPGALNGLAQTLLKLTVPGVPDIYEGGEFWDFSLVDPDNRRPVDWAARQHAFATSRSIAACLDSWRDGRVKQALIREILSFRADAHGCFAKGSYLPVTVAGPAAGHIVAFLREGAALVVVPHLTAGLISEADTLRIAPERWRDTRLLLPEASATVRFTDVLTGRSRTPHDGMLELSEILDRLPFALLKTA
jgi:(1->4)-alpha-D-glucan 1-alpha-D-glucosylmutase